MNSRSLLLTGPTGVGKSEVALILAEMLGGEIISVDSMQVYRGMDIGTAKPSPTERQRICHHLLDVLELTASFDAAQFVKLAEAAISEVHSRGHLPILCGGTGLYFQAFMHGLGEAPPANPVLRASLEATPLPILLRELAEHDPATYEQIDRRNPRRVIRAIEVIRLTNKPFSSLRANWPETAAVRPAPYFAISRAIADLHQRINLRVDRMFELGLVAETEKLLDQGLAQNRTATQALGYRQVLEYLNGIRSLAETIELVKVRSRQFAKRQMTWLRRQAGMIWVNVVPEDTPSNTAQVIAAQFTHCGQPSH